MGLGLYALAWNDAWACSGDDAGPVVSDTDNSSFACPEQPAPDMFWYWVAIAGFAGLWLNSKRKK